MFCYYTAAGHVRLQKQMTTLVTANAWIQVKATYWTAEIQMTLADGGAKSSLPIKPVYKCHCS